MITTAKNYDVICFQLRNNLYSRLESPLKKDLNKLSSDIKTRLTSGEKIQVQSMDILSQVFNLRIKALKWIAKDTGFDYLDMFKDCFLKIEEMKSNKKLEVLAENILFALRCNQRVAESLIATSDFSADSITSDISQIPEITFQQFITSLAFANLDNETAQKIVDWTVASLHIEFVLVATDIISNEKLKIADKTINELAFLVADAAQEYTALATELGVLKSNSTNSTFSNLIFDSSFIKEQKQFADSDLGDFATDAEKPKYNAETEKAIQEVKKGKAVSTNLTELRKLMYN